MGVATGVRRVRTQLESSLAWLEDQVVRRPSGETAVLPDPALTQALNRVPAAGPEMPAWARYGAGLGAAAVAGLVTWTLRELWHWEIPVALFAMATILVAWRWGAGAALCGAFLSVVALIGCDGVPLALAYVFVGGPVSLLVVILRRAGAGAHRRLLALARVLEDQRLLEARVHEVAKMEALGRLAGGVAHDFNNFLAVILSMAELMQHEPGLPEQTKVDLKEIVQSGRRATELTRQLLNFSRQQTADPEPINVGRFLERLLPMLRRLLPGSIVMELRGESRGTVLIDPTHLEQIIANLVINARDALDRSGTIQVTVATIQHRNGEPRNPPVPGDWHQLDYVGHLGQGAYTYLTVQDTGCGIDAATIRHIFEPFFTTKPRGRGTGFGLSNVYNLVQRCGGQIQVQSQVERGTSFGIFFPETLMPETVTEDIENTIELRSGRILLTEDDESVRNILARMLRAYGYEVLQAENGRVALQMLQADPGVLHALVTDIVMPLMSGIELGREVRRLQPTLPIIYMSGWSDEVVRSESSIAGALFLQKPFRPDALLGKLKECCEPA